MSKVWIKASVQSIMTLPYNSASSKTTELTYKIDVHITKSHVLWLQSKGQIIHNSASSKTTKLTQKIDVHITKSHVLWLQSKGQIINYPL